MNYFHARVPNVGSFCLETNGFRVLTDVHLLHKHLHSSVHALSTQRLHCTVLQNKIYKSLHCLFRSHCLPQHIFTQLPYENCKRKKKIWKYFGLFSFCRVRFTCRRGEIRLKQCLSSESSSCAHPFYPVNLITKIKL